MCVIGSCCKCVTQPVCMERTVPVQNYRRLSSRATPHMTLVNHPWSASLYRFSLPRLMYPPPLLPLKTLSYTFAHITVLVHTPVLGYRRIAFVDCTSVTPTTHLTEQRRMYVRAASTKTTVTNSYRLIHRGGGGSICRPPTQPNHENTPKLRKTFLFSRAPRPRAGPSISALSVQSCWRRPRV